MMATTANQKIDAVKLNDWVIEGVTRDVYILFSRIESSSTARFSTDDPESCRAEKI